MTHSFRSTLRRWTIRAGGLLLAAVVAVLAYALVAYGTVAPCGILEQEIMARVEESEQLQSAGDSPLESAAQALGLSIGEEALDAKLEDYSEVQCAQFMWDAKTGDGDELRKVVE